MHDRGVAFVLLIITLTEYACAHKKCQMPSGTVGECRHIKVCKPLYLFNKKRVKTESDILYLQQSQCGVTSNFKIMLCCPPDYLWDTVTFEFKPVLLNIIFMNDIKDKDRVDSGDKNIDTIVYSRNRLPKKNNTITRPTGVNERLDNIRNCGKDYSGSNRIVGGSYTAIDQYTWLVLLEYDRNKTVCGGSLITTRYVLTAAHCIKPNIPRIARLSQYTTISYPVNNMETKGGGWENITVVKIPIERNIAHEDFDWMFLHNDIGLSKLAYAATLGDFIGLICLPTRDLVPKFREPMLFTVAGWGSDGKEASGVKKHVRVPYVVPETCQMFHSFRGITDRQICAGGVLNEDSCRGDSGGPLMHEIGNTFFAVGIVSYGPRQCGTEGVPAVYTYVYPFIDWLKSNMD